MCADGDNILSPIACIICLKSTSGNRGIISSWLHHWVPLENQFASSSYSVGFILPRSRSTVGFIIRELHPLIFRQRSQIMRCGLCTLFLTSKTLCMQRISFVNVLLPTEIVLSWSGRFGGGHIGWSPLQLTSSVSPLCYCAIVCWFWKESSPYTKLNHVACSY